MQLLPFSQILCFFVVLLSFAPASYSQITDSMAMEIARQMDEEMAADSIAAALETEESTEEVVEEEVVEEELPYDLRYGNNDETGKLVKINGIGMYYEVYGEGEPLLLIHGNGGNIASMGAQIEHFSKNYQVIVADSRGHGNSELGTDNLTYKQMANDWIELMDRLDLEKVNILGWSDGGIIGLLMAINFPDRVEKLAAMGANIQPDKSAVRSWAVNWVTKLSKFIDQKIAEEDNTKDWFLVKQQMSLLGTQPNIPVEDLKKITAAVLILNGDNDIIRNEHAQLIYENIPNAHLCIFPGQTHFIPADDPELFNMMVERFLVKTFERPTSKEEMFKN